MEISVRITNNYGSRKIYPACDFSRIFANIAGTTTLTDRCIEHIKSLGITVNVEQQTL